MSGWIVLPLLLLVAFTSGAHVKRTKRQASGCAAEAWVPFNNMEYASSKDLHLKYEDASASCAACDASLVAIHSQEELTFVRSLQVVGEKTKEFWLGARDSSQVDGDFSWEDGTAWDFSQWRNGEPNDFSNEGTEGADCAVVNSGGKWRDILCDTRKRFICKRQIGQGVGIVSAPQIDPVLNAVETTPIPVTVNEDTSDYQRTVLLLNVLTDNGQDIFFRGGLDHSQMEEGSCPEDAASSLCAIPIRVIPQDTSISDRYNEMSEGDNYLDWYGKEVNQSNFGNFQAHGSQALWTTNDANDDRYVPFNMVGQNVWMLDMEMDCSRTKDGYFEVKGFKSDQYNNNHWEWNVEGQGATCPYDSSNHVAQCGKINFFNWGEKSCDIQDFQL